MGICGRSGQVTHNKLFTDDTFQFVAAARGVTAALEDLPRGDTPAEVAKRAAVIRCLATLHNYHRYAWAKPPVDLAFDAAAQRRLQFNTVRADQASACLPVVVVLTERVPCHPVLQEHRSQLDEWYNDIVARRRGSAGGVGAGGGIVAPSGVNDKSVRGNKGVWHPLFNRTRK